MVIAIAFIRGKKGRVKYNSGLHRFNFPESAERFKKNLEKNENIEVVIIKEPSKHIEPPEDFEPVLGKLFCTSCGSHEKFVSSSNGKECPICGISEFDFYIKKYNKLWGGKK